MAYYGFRKRRMSRFGGPAAKRMRYRRRALPSRFGRRVGRFRRRRRTRRGRRRGGNRWYNQSMKKVHIVRLRSESTELTVGTNDYYISNFNTDFTPTNRMWKGCHGGVLGLDVGRSADYDVCKILSTKMYIKLSDPGEVYNGVGGEINDMVFFTCYDPDGEGRQFLDLQTFNNVVHTKRRNLMDLRKEYCMRFYPKWPKFMTKAGDFNHSVEAVSSGYNPWWDIGAFAAGKDQPAASLNAMQWCFKAKSGVKFRVRYEHVIGYRGQREGQQYATELTEDICDPIKIKDPTEFANALGGGHRTTRSASELPKFSRGPDDPNPMYIG